MCAQVKDKDTFTPDDIKYCLCYILSIKAPLFSPNIKVLSTF
jgi:hypothetical protein